MKTVIVILIPLLAYACTTQPERKEELHTGIDSENSVNGRNKGNPVSESDVMNIIPGFFQDKLEITDPKVVQLKSYANEKKLNKEIRSGTSNEAEYFTTYLGKLKLKGIETQVFKQFYTIRAAIEKHGHSVLILVNENGATYYDMKTPENLPLDMKDGVFRYKNSSDTLLMKIEYISDQELFLRKVAESNYNKHEIR